MNPGDHVRNRKIQGGTWVVLENTESHVRVRCRETEVPALIPRSDLDRWRVVWSPELTGPGLEGLRREGRMLVRVDA